MLNKLKNGRSSILSMYLDYSTRGLMLVLCLTALVLAFTYKTTYLQIITFSYILVGITCFLLARLTNNSFIKLNLIFFFRYSFLATTSFVTGGVSSPFIHWYVVACMLTSFKGSVKETIFWTVIGLLSISALSFLSFHNISYNEFSPSETSFLKHISLSFSIVYVVTMCILFKIQNEKEEDKKLILNTKANQQEHLKALGQMAGGVAHEINNPLTIISGSASAIRKNMLGPAIDKQRVLKHLNVIDKTIIRTGQIIRGMRNLSRDGEGDPKEYFTLRDAFDDVFGYIGKKLKLQAIDVKFDEKSSLLDKTVYFRRVQLSQAFLNLINNSCDALESLDEKWIKIEFINKTSHVDVHFIDSGEGISHNLQDKIFNPLFTTKVVGKGTGLGLSLCHTIMSKNNGFIKVDTSRKNTSFVLSIPYHNMSIIKDAA